MRNIIIFIVIVYYISLNKKRYCVYDIIYENNCLSKRICLFFNTFSMPFSEESSLQESQEKIFSFFLMIYSDNCMSQWVDEMNVAEVNSRNVIVEVPASRKLISEELPVTLPVATATMAPFTTNLNDVFISVKTTRHYHHSRLPAIIDTWFQFARNQVSFFYSVQIAVKCQYSGFISVARLPRFLRPNLAITSLQI